MNDATVKGGTYYPLTVKKQLRLQSVARRLRLPCVYLVDSGGVFFFRCRTRSSPTSTISARCSRTSPKCRQTASFRIAAVMGSCTAGGAYIPAMCDETVIVRGTGTVYLGGPQLVKAATGVDVEPQELGGADVHGVISGVVDHIANDDIEALSIIADIVARGDRREVRAPSRSPRPPLHSPEQLDTVIPASSKTPIVARDVLAHLLDASELVEYRANYGRTIVCGTGHIEGYTVGVIMNDGVLFSEDSLKAANPSNCAHNETSHCCSCTTSTDSWSGSSTRRKVSPNTARNWSMPLPAPGSQAQHRHRRKLRGGKSRDVRTLDRS